MQSYQNVEKILRQRKKLGIQLGLARFELLLEKLGNPQKKFRAIHVAGTNGKGSVSAITEAILNQAGYKTGLYTSPHFFEYRERIRVNSQIISRSEFCRFFLKALKAAQKIEKETKGKIFFTEFELLTAAAFLVFAEKKVTLAVLEVGLGGRLDATSLCQPVVSVITRIGFDHREFLGNTLKKIAGEKAGIIKKNVPVAVIRDTKTNPVIRKIARAKNAPVFIVSAAEEKLAEKYWSYLSLGGAFQKENLTLVFKILALLKKQGFKIPVAAWRLGLKKVFWPGRFQILKRNPTFVLDGGHNPQAARALVKALKQRFPGRKIIFVVGILKRKDFRGILKELTKIAEVFYLINRFDEPTWSFAKMSRFLKTLGLPAAGWAEVSQPATDSAEAGQPASRFNRKFLKKAKNKIFCFTGSLKVVAQGLKLLA